MSSSSTVLTLYDSMEIHNQIKLIEKWDEVRWVQLSRSDMEEQYREFFLWTFGKQNILSLLKIYFRRGLLKWVVYVDIGIYIPGCIWGMCDWQKCKINTMRFDQRWKILLFSFLILKIMKWPWLSPYFKSSVSSYWLLCIKWKYSEYSFSYAILQSEVYRDPGKGKVIADSVITTTSIDLCKQ